MPRLAIGVAAGARSVQHAASNLKDGHVEIVCAAQIRVNVMILYQPLTAPNRLGLLGVSARGRTFRSGGAARSLPERWPADLPRGRTAYAVQGHQLAYSEGQPSRCPFSNRQQEWTPRRATLRCLLPCRSFVQELPGLWITNFQLGFLCSV